MTERDRDLELHKELDAALQARKDLGAEYESALVESFLDKLDSRLDSQIERRVRRQLAEQNLDRHRPGRPRKVRERGFTGLPYVSMVLAIPLSGIGMQEGLTGLLVTWAGIVGVNIGHLWFSHKERQDEDRAAERSKSWDD